jgi:DNA-binding NtrC family response regulator
MEYAAAANVHETVEPGDLEARLQEAALLVRGAGAGEPARENLSVESVGVAAARPPLAEELRALERGRIVEALAQTGGVQKRAAALIGMPLRTFASKVKHYGLRRDS